MEDKDWRSDKLLMAKRLRDVGVPFGSTGKLLERFDGDMLMVVGYYKYLGCLINLNGRMSHDEWVCKQAKSYRDELGLSPDLRIYSKSDNQFLDGSGYYTPDSDKHQVNGTPSIE